MSEFDYAIGSKIRFKREMLGMSQKEMSAKLELLGFNVSPSMYSMIESGHRRLYADTLGAICQILGCSTTSIYPLIFDYEGFKDKLLQELVGISSEDLYIIEYALIKWNGNPRALVRFCALYMSLPPMIRQDISGYGVHLYKSSIKNGNVNPHSPNVDIDYIEKESDRLWKWNQADF